MLGGLSVDFKSSPGVCMYENLVPRKAKKISPFVQKQQQRAVRSNTIEIYAFLLCLQRYIL